ncbi:hypothetical protein CsatB_016840 [Cannabis sativa]|uniref:uncharacterized protein LOC133035958 n=1 Tax=Cannabis sativa TaxID=3483 RepID=UPI0029CA21A5|nr:uncharacterized protein LOC133035958 [Cannabis sativa]
MALKLDVSKTYDKLEWGYLRAMMARMGFDGRWINLVRQCVCSVSYTILHGGKELGPIGAQRGLRQGDPLSPYLFILCAEGFSSLLRSYEQCATEEEAHNVKELLHTYEVASGQRINFAKSSVFFSNSTNCHLRDVIYASLEIYEADENGYYLGLPCSVGRNKNAILRFLKDKLRKRIQGCEGRLLSRAGKEVLLKTVAQALPNYAMNVFLFPLETWKQFWQLLVNDSLLVSRIYKAKYYAQGSLFSAELGDNLSFIWQSIMEVRSLIYSRAQRTIANGVNVSILDDPSLSHNTNGFVETRHLGLVNKTVSCLLQMDTRAWDEDVVRNLFVARDQDLIFSIQLSDLTVRDGWSWKFESCGQYSVKSAYKFLHETKGAWSVDGNTEIVHHALVECEFATAAWNRNSVDVGGGSATFSSWLLLLFGRRRVSEMEEAAVVSWAIWCRNNFVWQQKSWAASNIIASAKNMLDQYKCAQGRSVWCGLRISGSSW